MTPVLDLGISSGQPEGTVSLLTGVDLVKVT